ncbi:PREDICTED: pectinesterase-like [Nicotiana attenuata]|uniref:Pectinesterase n=1 Tax=Nicotiana attenuata TaxID=49451 RepID=A0A314L606_NICAT|nr:PREDICTED: pectinesterase-like [Nicotiana attenuata]OIT37056.1 putative pectinesterasepectinesterase inhibitor 21 [Nicotiana attenuata]
MADAGKKKIAIAGIASILLVACIVGAAVTLTKKDSDNSSNSQVSTSTKNVQVMCQPTQYKETCEKSLSSAKNTSDPKELIKTAFDSTINEIASSIKNSAPFKEAANDPRTKDALKVCDEVLDRSIEEIKRSFNKFDSSDVKSLVKDYIYDLRSWLSSAVTFETTCIDAFANTTGDTGDKMKNLLKNAHELSTNALDIVSSFEEQVEDLQILGITNRRLLTVEAGNRRLLQVAAIKPNVVVAQDGSGQHKSINEALKTVPPNNAQPYVIFIKAGIYNEYVQVANTMTNVVFIGEGPNKTKITGNKNYLDGLPVFSTATVAISGQGFVAKDIGFENSAGPLKHQAVALRVSAEMAVFQNCQIDGYQYTLMTHVGRQFYRDCTITGTIDFIFGDAVAVFQNCKLIARKPEEMQTQAITIAAQGRNQQFGTGAIIIQNCTITAEPALLAINPPRNKAYLGRPWKLYSRTIIMQSQIDGFIDPEGWTPWAGTFALDTLYFVEYQNRGPGANTDKRVNWKNYIKNPTPDVIAKFTPGVVLKGGDNTDSWVTKTGVPYEPGMMKV